MKVGLHAGSAQPSRLRHPDTKGFCWDTPGSLCRWENGAITISVGLRPAKRRHNLLRKTTKEFSVARGERDHKMSNADIGERLNLAVHFFACSSKLLWP